MNILFTYLEEAQKVVGLGRPAGDVGSLTEGSSKDDTLTERTVLDGGREERRRRDFFPQIEPTLRSQKQSHQSWPKVPWTYVV